MHPVRVHQVRVNIISVAEPTSELPVGAPVILFSLDLTALSEATVGPSSYSPPRGIVPKILEWRYVGVDL